MDDFIPLAISCVYCGKPISARRDFSGPYQIVGLHKLDYIHTETSKTDCYIKRTAQPYDGFLATKAYEEAKAEALNG